MNGSQDKLLARLIAMMPLLLAGPVKRQDLAQALGHRLDDLGWSEAFGAEEGDPISVLDRDIKRLKNFAWLDFGERRTYDATPLPDLPLWLAPQEAQALRLALAVLDQLGLPEASNLAALLKRVDPLLLGRGSSVPPTVAPSLEGMKPEHWRAVLQGVEEGRKMSLSYRKPKQEPEVVKLDRARLMWLGGAFFLVAYVPAKRGDGVAEHDCVREYRLDRIEAVTLHDAKVSRGQLPLLEGEAILSKHLANRVMNLKDAEGHWVQKTHIQSDGRVHFRFRAPSLLRAQQKLWNYGPQVEEVLGPPALVSAMAPYTALGKRLREDQP